MESNKINAQFWCMEDESFYFLIETLYERLKGKDTPEKWLNSEQVMAMLNISSPTTLLKLRNEQAFVFSMLSKKNILYDRESVEAYINKKKQKAWH